MSIKLIKVHEDETKSDIPSGLVHVGGGGYARKKGDEPTHRRDKNTGKVVPIRKPVSKDTPKKSTPSKPSSAEYKGGPGKLGDRDDELSDGAIKQKALEIGFKEKSEHTAPGNPGSMANEIMSGEVSGILMSKPDMSDDDLIMSLYDQIKDTALGKQLAKQGTIATSRSKSVPEGLNTQIYNVMKASALAGKQKHNRIKKAVGELKDAGKVNPPMKVRNFYGTAISLQKQIDLIEKSNGPFYTNTGAEIPKDRLIHFIKNSGGGDNPCDTATIATDDNGACIVTFHSDKMTTGDILSNTTPNSEAKAQIGIIDNIKAPNSVKQKAKETIEQSIKDLDNIEKAFDDAAIPVAQSLQKVDKKELIKAIKAKADVASRFIGGKSSVFQGAKGKYKFPTDLPPDASEEEQLNAFLDYMADPNKPKAPSKDMIKFVSRMARTQKIKTDFSGIRKKAINRQQKLLDDLNNTSIKVQGQSMGLGNYLEKKTLFKNLHLDIMDGEGASNEIFRYGGLLNVNHGGVVVEAKELQKALGVSSTDELMLKVKIGKPGTGQTVTKNAKTGAITGRNIFMYILDEEGNRVPFAYKTQRSKQGETGRTNNTIQYTKEMQERLVENSVTENLTEAKQGQTLAFFDIDNTVFNTFAKVIVRDKDGDEVTQLTNSEYNAYKLKSGEDYDYSQFGSAKMFKDTAKVIKSTMKKVKQEFKNKSSIIYFLTARADFDSNSMFKDTFREQGLRVNDKRIRFELAGNLSYGTIPARKKYIIEKQIKRYNPNIVKFYDDHVENINVLDEIAPDNPTIRFEKYLVKNGVIINKGKINEITSFATITEASVKGKNTHMTHIEDRVLYGGVKGAREAIFALRGMRDMLAGKESKTTDATVKWDGAPAIFAGTDPSDGKFFVAKKGIFNKNPKVYKTNKDIDNDTSGDLNAKLKVALRELEKLGIKNVVQGDLLFTNDVEKETIDGESYYTFQPNTIVYAVRTKSLLGQKINKAKIGIIFHTTYTGKDFESMQASYKVDIGSFKKSPSIFFDDAGLKDVSGTLFSQAETDEVTAALSKAGKIFQKIAGTTLRQIEKDPTLAQEIETFNNTYVRAGEKIGDTRKHVSDLLKWYGQRYQKEKDKRKSQAGKDKIDKIAFARAEFFNPVNRANLQLVFELQKQLVVAKELIISKLDRVKRMSTFVRTKQGFKVTGQEGFVAIDKIGGGAIKLVDRLEFSYNNFSKDVIKGWEK